MRIRVKIRCLDTAFEYVFGFGDLGQGIAENVGLGSPRQGVEMQLMPITVWSGMCPPLAVPRLAQRWDPLRRNNPDMLEHSVEVMAGGLALPSQGLFE